MSADHDRALELVGELNELLAGFTWPDVRGGRPISLADIHRRGLDAVTSTVELHRIAEERERAIRPQVVAVGPGPANVCPYCPLPIDAHTPGPMPGSYLCSSAPAGSPTFLPGPTSTTAE